MRIGVPPPTIARFATSRRVSTQTFALAMKILIDAILLACLLVSSATAQGSSGATAQATTVVPRPVHLDLATGTLTRGTPPVDRAGTLVSEYGSQWTSGYIANAPGNGATEFISAGLKGHAGNASDLVARAQLAYWSVKQDPSLGGPGGSVRLGFYEGYTPGGATPTTTVAVFTLTGLPGNSASSSFPAGLRSYFLTLDFGTALSFADGPIGYSWRFIDTDLGGVDGGTGPFLSCVLSCSGGGPDAFGQMGPHDIYSPPGTLVAPFPVSVTESMELFEIGDFAATVAPVVGDGVNQDVLTAAPAVIGQPWSVTLTIPGGAHHHGPGGPFVLRVRTSAINGPTFNSPLGGRPTEALIAGPLLAQFTTTQHGITGSVGPVPIPLLIAIVDTPWAAQATVIGGGFGDLSRGVAGRVGTQ